jgi:rhodanese-related sulfurtransferase
MSRTLLRRAAALSLAVPLGLAACTREGPASRDTVAGAAAPSPSAPRGRLEDLDAVRFRALAEEKKGLLLDVRTAGEVAAGKLPGASHIDVSDPRARKRFALLPHDWPIFVYCASGARSAAAGRMLQELGFAEVYNLEGGIYAWQRNGFPVERPAGAAAARGAGGLTPEAFDGLRKSEQRLLVDFQTPWCEPCVRMAPVLDALAESWKGRAKVLRVDIDQSDALAAREKVEGVPLLVLYVGGQERWRHSGEVSREVIEQALAKP